jgi:arsenate reductase
MAEGYLKSFDKKLEVYSAGTKPADKVNPFAVKAMSEVGIDINNGIAEDVDKYVNQSFNFVITVCDNAKKVCPVFNGEVKQQLHMPFEDPYEATGSEEEVFAVYRKVRDNIFERLNQFYKKEIAH